MNIRKLLVLSSFLTLGAFLLSACQGNSSQPNKPSPMTYKDSVAASVKKYPVCNVDKIATALRTGNNVLGKKLEVHFREEKESGHPYYMILYRGAFNADQIRKAVCGYVVKNNCRLYWGNVASIAMIAKKRAPKYPADTSPHYMISPDLTCNKIMAKH